MRIGIDLTALLPQATGVDNYLLRLVRGLAEVDGRNRYVVFANREDRERLRDLPESFDVVPASIRDRLVRLGFQQAVLPLLAVARNVEVIHSPSFMLPLVARRAKHVLTIHDMTSFSLARHHAPLRRSSLYRAAIVASIRRAERICVPSRRVRDEIVRFVPDVDAGRIRVIPFGVSSEFTPEALADAPVVRRRLQLTRPYLLCVGTIQPRKNLELLLETYGRLAATGAVEEDLVLAGRLGWGYDRVVELAQSPSLAGRVHMLGYVDQGLLAGLYAGARVFAYPSLEEGFGLPPLEAMACGIPVVASTAPALVENLTGAAELVPSDGPDALAEALVRLLRDEPLRELRRRQGLARAQRFRWEQTAKATLACYEEVGGNGG